MLSCKTQSFTLFCCCNAAAASAYRWVPTHSSPNQVFPIFNFQAAPPVSYQTIYGVPLQPAGLLQAAVPVLWRPGNMQDFTPTPIPAHSTKSGLCEQFHAYISIVHADEAC